MSHRYQMRFRENSAVAVLARVTSRTGTNGATGKNGEGQFIRQADLASISCAIFQQNGEGQPLVAGATPAVALSAILDTPELSRVDWDVDDYGYNFVHDLPASAFPDGGDAIRYVVEYLFTPNVGDQFYVVAEGPADAVETE
jgi:hypothetical protein